jgi:hypothetical protein
LGALRFIATLAVLMALGALVYGGMVAAMFGPQWFRAFRRRHAPDPVP